MFFISWSHSSINTSHIGDLNTTTMLEMERMKFRFEHQLNVVYNLFNWQQWVQSRTIVLDWDLVVLLVYVTWLQTLSSGTVAVVQLWQFGQPCSSPGGDMPILALSVFFKFLSYFLRLKSIQNKTLDRFYTVFRKKLNYTFDTNHAGLSQIIVQNAQILTFLMQMSSKFY